jgi:hypothetical protein
VQSCRFYRRRSISSALSINTDACADLDDGPTVMACGQLCPDQHMIDVAARPRTPLPSSVSSLITRKCLAFVPSEAVVGLEVQGSTAETRELGLIFESNWLGVDPRLSVLPCRATGLVLGE